MADQKISQLAQKTTPVSNDLTIIVDSASPALNKKITVGSLPISNATQLALNEKLEMSDIAGKQDVINAFDKAILYQASSSGGDIQGIPDWQVNQMGGLTQTISQTANNGGPKEINNHNANIINSVASPNESYKLQQNNVSIDAANDGNDLGTNGKAITFYNNNVNSQSSASIGEIVFNENGFTIGNGTDIISARGLSYSYGFGTFKNGVNINGPLQGYGFQPTIESGVTLDPDAYTSSFYDALNAEFSIVGAYTSFQSSPFLGGIANNKNFSGLILNPTIEDFQGNAGFQGVLIAGDLGTVGTSGYTGLNLTTNIEEVTNAIGVNISPSIDSCQNYTGLNVNVENVNATNKKAASFNGDVDISGALAISKINASFSSNPVDSGTTPQVIHSAVSSITSLNGVSTINADTIGLTAVINVTLEEDSSSTSGPFGLGFTGMATPCVVRTETNSFLDNLSGVTAAINLDGTSTGGEIDTVKLFRSAAVPNGVTQINNLRAFQYDAPFGQVGAINHGFYTAIDCHNYFRGNLVIGEISETAANSNVGLEISSSSKAILNSRMTTTQRDLMTPINGMQIYNTTTDKLQCYAGGNWVDLH
jgi:hypothetical protein